MSAINFIIGNTYTKLSDARAKLDKSGNCRKVHDWTLYVDFLGPDADLIKKVEFNMGSTFEPSKFVSQCPIKVPGSNGNRWRFQSRQQTYGPLKVKVAIIGRGGTVLRREHRVQLRNRGYENNVEAFVERHPNKPLAPVPMDDVEFGIELELSTSEYVSYSTVANAIQTKASVNVLDMTNDFAAARARTDVWVVMLDSSLICSIDRPNCNRFELVSPILKGGNGLGEVDRVIRALGDISSIKVNHSMGFHCHVNIANLSLAQLKKVCQNFVKYEEAMDNLMPPSRRENNYCLSNRLAAGRRAGAPNREIHDRIASCTSIQGLGNLMSPSRYYKLNMRPLLSGRQPTIEFRQHSSTYNRKKVTNWVRFCVNFVQNSAKLRTPSHISSAVDDAELFEMMMMYVVKDRFLRDFYRQRRIDVGNQGSGCCDGCASGSGCDAGASPFKLPGH